MRATKETGLGRRAGIAAVAALAAGVAGAQEGDPCTPPGLLVAEDAGGDAVGGGAYADIRSVHMAEPGALPGRLVFTYKVADLSVAPPNLGWILRFSTGAAPPNGDEDYFVAMFTTPAGPRYVHGSNGAQVQPRVFNIAGDLDEGSGHDADGTITLILDKAVVPGLLTEPEVFNILPTVRVFTPTHATGMTANGANNTILDDAPAGYYPLGTECEEKSGFLGIGAFGAPGLGLLLLAALAGIRRKR